MIGSINNVNTLNSVSNVKRNNVSFAKKQTYTTTTTVSEGKPKEKKGFFAKIGLAIAGFFGALFAIGAITDKAKAKKGSEKPAAEEKPEVKPEGEKPVEVTAVEGEKPVASVDTKGEVVPVVIETGDEKPVDIIETGDDVPPEALEVGDGKPADIIITGDDETVDIIETGDEKPVDIIETGDDKPVVVPEKVDEAPVNGASTDETANDVIVGTQDALESAPKKGETAQATQEIATGVMADGGAVALAAPVEEAPIVEASNDNKKQAQALLTAGVAGAMTKALPASNGEVSAVEYADAQKAQLGINVAKPAASEEVKVDETKIDEAIVGETKVNGYDIELNQETVNEVLEDAFEVSLKGETMAKHIKDSFKEFRGYVKEADRNDFGDIETEDGGLVTFEKRVEYPAGETTGIVDEAITKHTREKEKQEILTATKLDANGNIEATATYINGRIDSLMETATGGKMNIIQADDKGVLFAKGMKQAEAGVAFDEILNYDYVGDTRRLVSYAKDVTIENGVTKIAEAYKYDQDNNLKEKADDVVINGDGTGSLGVDVQFESDNMSAGASSYSGNISDFGVGIAQSVLVIEDGKIVGIKNDAEYTVNV